MAKSRTELLSGTQFMSRMELMVGRLRDLQTGTPDIEASAVVSVDGLIMASALPAAVEEDRVSAMSAAMLSLGERIAAAHVRFFRHAVIFLFVNAGLFGADFFLTRGTTFAPWVAFVWAFFLFFHFMNAFVLHKDRLERMKQNRIDKLMGNR